MTSPPVRRQRPRLGAFAHRPRLLAGLGVGAGVWLLLQQAPQAIGAVTSVVLAWDAACLTFILGAVAMMWGAVPSAIRATAATQDEGQGMILGLTLAAAAASIGVVTAELSAAQSDQGWVQGLRVGLAFGTVALSWFVVQLIFALHYAHEYYAPDRSAAEPGGGEVTGGLAFPGAGEPDYWDFLHFSVIIGVACQTADIAFTSKALRRIGTVHGVAAFVFNTVIVALTINLVATLF